jgi:carboxypeptidase T
MKKKLIVILVCMLLITIIYPVVGTGNTSFDGNIDEFNSPTMLVRISIGAAVPTLPTGVEIASCTPGESVDVIIPAYRIQEIANLHFPYSIIINDMESYDREMAGSYHTLAQIQSTLEGIATNYPSITQLTSIGTTYESRDIWCLEISDNPGVDEGEPGVFFMGVHHAREWPGAEICLYIANKLTSEYGSNSTITDLVNNRRIWIVAVVNPDGYYYCHDLGNDWRKNRQYFPQYGTYGVDLNRNYNGSSNGDSWGAWGSIASGSVTHNPGDEVYCGPEPSSELEIQAISNFFIDHNICASISWHTYQEELYWPWGYTASHTPDDTYISSVGTQIAQRITRQSGSGTYTPKQAVGLYPTVGDNIDWEYGFSHYVLGRTTFPFTIEACSDFHPSASYLDQICKENCDGALYLLSEAENIQDTVVPRVLPPILDKMPNDSDGNYRVSWQEQNPIANPDHFQLDELTNLTIVTDDAESGSGLWTLDGFALSTTRYHSGSYSFKSRHSDADVSSMTTLYPTPITSGMKLSFWCWYATEENFDDAFVEVSKDGRSFDILDIFTGSSGGWSYKEYDLSDYSGKSLFIRLRYTTDQGTLLEGFYVDDITLVTHIGTIATLSSSITNHFYDITGKHNGTYYYRVDGFNSARGWGDFSTLERIIVKIGGGNDTTPPVTICTLAGDIEGGVYVSDVNVTLTATDDGSGVYYTNYKLDNGAWTTYTAPFVVSTNGNHTVRFYSADKAGNTETEKNSSFIIQQEVPQINITIRGGLTVSATIKNTGATTLTNLSWTITLDGKNIFLGKTKTDVIAALAPGESKTVRDFAIGFGKTGIAVNVGATETSATGTVILFFVIGVK